MIEWPNIVQAEFFHVGGEETPSLKAFKDQVREVVNAGLEMAMHGYEVPNGLKTVVRFYDTNNLITGYVQLYLKVEEECETLRASTSTNWLTGWWRDRKYRAASEEKAALHELVKSLTVSHLTHRLRDVSDVTLESLDHRFRPARREEMGELCEAAQRAVGLWLFIFEHNDLLSDKNTILARFM